MLVKLDIRKNSAFKGYHPFLSSNNDPKNTGDMNEGFAVGWEQLDAESEDSKTPNDGVIAGANVWPDGPPSFRTAVLQY